MYLIEYLLFINGTHSKLCGHHIVGVVACSTRGSGAVRRIIAKPGATLPRADTRSRPYNMPGVPSACGGLIQYLTELNISNSKYISIKCIVVGIRPRAPTLLATQVMADEDVRHAQIKCN